MVFSLAEIRDAVGGRLLGDSTKCCHRVILDSRRVQPGDLFVAIKGERHDGHHFIPQAVEAGAAGLIVSEPVEAPAGVGVIVVADTVAALGALARHHRRRFALPVVAVTGSTGKTSTKEMIAAIGETAKRVRKNRGNQNNEIGLPLTLLELEPADELLVVEMGMRGLGQIAALAAIAEPSIGVVTNIGLTHLELLGSREAIAQAKGELVQALPSDGAAVLNHDDDLCRSLAAKSRARVITFGLGEGATVRAEALADTGSGSKFTVSLPGRPAFTVELAVPGAHHVSNALAASAVGYVLGYDSEAIRLGLASFGLERGRGAAVASKHGWTVIDDTYNASPDSVEAALRLLERRHPSGRKFAVLGDMLELGPAAREAHRGIGRTASRSGLSGLFVYGDLTREAIDAAVEDGFPIDRARHYENKEALAADLRGILQPGDLVLVKGSRGMKMEDVVQRLIE